MSKDTKTIEDLDREIRRLTAAIGEYRNVKAEEAASDWRAAFSGPYYAIKRFPVDTKERRGFNVHIVTGHATPGRVYATRLTICPSEHAVELDEIGERMSLEEVVEVINEAVIDVVAHATKTSSK